MIDFVVEDIIICQLKISNFFGVGKFFVEIEINVDLEHNFLSLA